MLFLLIIFTVPLTQTAIEAGQGPGLQLAELFSQVPGPADLRAFEREMENSSWFARTLRPWTQYIHFLVLRDAGDKAISGCDGWLFYKPAVQYLIEPLPPGTISDTGRDNIISAVTSFHDDLAARNIRLLVVIAPNKASVYPEMLTKRAGRTKQPVNQHTLEIISLFRQSGVQVLDLFDVYARTRWEHSDTAGPKYYLAQDSHWSPEGVRLAAKAAADRLFELGWAAKGAVEYNLKPVEIERHGDVLEMTRVPQIKTHFRPQRLNCTQVVKKDTARLYRDEPDSEILVLGDSFLRIYEKDEPGSAGFIAHLAYELGFGLASIVNDGGASTLVRQQLYRKPALLADKKVVIWQFVERDIRFGTQGWQHVPLPGLEGLAD